MVKKVLMILLVGGFVVGSSSSALAVGEVELHKLTASDANTGDTFGESVAISGDTAIVGAYLDNHAGDSSGSAYLFDVTTGSQIAKLTASDAAAGDDFSHFAVAISGTTAIVGAYGNDDNGHLSGSAYLYDFSDPCNIIETKLTASDANTGDRFGCSVSISGSTALVGAWGNDNWSGSAYLFDVTTGSEIAKLTASDAAREDAFGDAVAISGSTALVGAPWNDDAPSGSNSGSAYLFDFSDPCNITEIKLTASDHGGGQNFGNSLAISGVTALVKGGSSAYLFDAATGSEIAKLTASDAAAGDDFGYSVAISGVTALVGARLNDDDGADSGSAYLFDFSDPCNIIETKLTASDAAEGDAFGGSVSISGSTTIVGAAGNDDAGENSGSAYLFRMFCPVGDINQDCRVDFKDFALMAGNWLVDCLSYPSDPACLGP
jgi:hypothetical protein